jgi:hypothetical protein
MGASGGRSKGSALLPAAAAGSGIATKPPRDSADQALGAFLDAIGGRIKLVEALEIGAPQAEIDKVLDLLADPRYDRWSLRQICELAGLSVPDLLVAFRSATLIKAQIAATQTIAAGIVPVVADIMHRAAPHEGVCPICDGLGQITPNPTKKQPNPAPEDCRSCHGRGRLQVLPELERQKLAIDLADLVKKGGGISLNQQNVTIASGGGSAVGALERMQQAVGRVLSGSPLVLDVEPSLATADADPATAPTPVVEGPPVLDPPPEVQGAA